MQELTALSPPQTFRSLPNMQTLGVVDVQKAFNNLMEGPGRTKHALRNHCYLEVISLRLQHADFWLRMFWVARNTKGEIFSVDDKRTFGTIIKDCKLLGFDDALSQRLQEFNKQRVDAIHKYLLGATSYEEFREVCEISAGLDVEVREYVCREVGTFV